MNFIKIIFNITLLLLLLCSSLNAQNRKNWTELDYLNFLEDNDAEKYARILCHYLPLTITAFLPKEEDYQRLDSRFMAPTHICYGGNNRTTLIRIPDSLPKRIEHRLASADANPYEVIYAILSSIYSGLKHPQQITKIDKIYGNAYDPQYNLVKILRSN
jgi:glutamine synthetase